MNPTLEPDVNPTLEPDVNPTLEPDVNPTKEPYCVHLKECLLYVHLGLINDLNLI